MRFVVHGTCNEKIAELCIEAENAADAKEAWEKQFPNYVLGFWGWSLSIWNLDGEQAELEKNVKRYHNIVMWKGSGESHYSGGYCHA